MSNIKLLNVIRAPRVSEKTARLQEINQYVFEVATTATKGDIKSAIESLFNVKVADVNTIVQRGKIKRMGRGLAKRPNYKKAVVTLREGNDIQFFDESKE